MIRNFRSLKLILIFIVLLGCSKSLPELSGIDLDRWKDDHNACNGSRSEMIDPLRNQKGKLLGLSEMEIIKLLGRPDENELYKRNQKFYHYFLEPSANCEHATENPARLSIRFNAMGLAKEVAVE